MSPFCGVSFIYYKGSLSLSLSFSRDHLEHLQPVAHENVRLNALEDDREDHLLLHQTSLYLISSFGTKILFFFLIMRVKIQREGRKFLMIRIFKYFDDDYDHKKEREENERSDLHP